VSETGKSTTGLHPRKRAQALILSTDLDVLEAVDASDTVTDAQDAARLFEVGLGRGAEDALLEDGGDFGRSGGRIGAGGGRQLLGQDADGSGLLADLEETPRRQFIKLFFGPKGKIYALLNFPPIPL
jgi:hypothetical protein